MSGHSNPILIDQAPRLLSKAPGLQRIKEDFFQLSKISPDGSCLLSSTDSNFVDFYKINHQVLTKNLYYDNLSESVSANPRNSDMLELVKSVDVGDTLYDFHCHPLQQDSCSLPLFVVATRDHPVQLFSPSDGRVLGSYTPVNQFDELDCTISVAFNPQGTHIFAGADRKIRRFDVSYPGRNYTEFITSESKKAFFGQKGLISSMTFNPDASGVFAAGSYRGDVSIYAESSPGQSYLDIARLGFGVNALRWSPCGRYLWIGGRHSAEISCWDIRGTKRQVGSVTRHMSSNQRTLFDIDPWGQYLATGDQSGKILVYNTSTFELVQTVDTGVATAVNACHFHPYSSLLIASQGERSFPISISDDDDDDSIDESVLPFAERKPTEETILGKKRSIEQVDEGCRVAEKRSNSVSGVDILASLLGKRKALAAEEDGDVQARKKVKEAEAPPRKSHHESFLYLWQMEKLSLHYTAPAEAVDHVGEETVGVNSSESNKTEEIGKDVVPE